jgi:hypothetical protein
LLFVKDAKSSTIFRKYLKPTKGKVENRPQILIISPKLIFCGLYSSPAFKKPIRYNSPQNSDATYWHGCCLGIAVVISLSAPFGLPAPIFWGALVAWIPIPPTIMVGLLFATMAYALLVHLCNLQEWRTEEEDPESIFYEAAEKVCV